MFYALIMVLCSGGDCRSFEAPVGHLTMADCLIAAISAQQDIKKATDFMAAAEAVTEVHCCRVEK